MSRDEILALPAGRELDALVAEKMMGYAERIIWYGKGTASACPMVDGAFPVRVSDYSTDIAAAWQIVEKLADQGDVFVEWWQDGEWTVANKPLTVRDCGIVASSPTMPLAVCRAALLALEAS